MIMKTKNTDRILAAAFAVCVYIIGCSVPNVKAQYEDYMPKPTLYCDGKTIAEVIFSNSGNLTHCVLHEVEEDEDVDVIIQASGLPSEYIGFKTMLDLVNNCTKMAMPLFAPLPTEVSFINSTELSSNWSPWSLWSGILPGTKWCGVGDIADSFEELGTQYDVDACCRAHDFCPVKLKAFRTGYGLLNLSLYTKSHCDCDREFFGCLKESRNKLADAVGNLYFNFMRIQCLRNHKPFVCVENRTEIDGSQHCSKWSEDPNSKKMRVTIMNLKY